ncbi:MULTISPECIES: hypothetical protein [Pedobacter]|uniref:hypothetical protein n=1 Tax=Pedobacter TaxID=84567 RepID=UPI001217829D|nr:MULTISPECIES: hypothetical protein [Pedobacter]RZL31548.1 MAG: hypothetical protein EOO96_15915 [Pedobacter sp.]
MKRLTASIFAISLLFFACKKKNDGPGEIYGKWKLTETLQDPGDGSGKYMKVNGPAKYLVLDQTGQISGKAMPELIRFKVIDSVSMEVYGKTYQMPLTYRYKVTAKTLTLNPPCIEGCGFKFVRD